MRNLTLCTAFLLALPAMVAQAEESLSDRLTALGGAKCADSDLICLTLPMPIDRRANDPDQTVDITLAISLASEESKGVLFFYVGGPGGAGAVSAPDYLPYYRDELVTQMDIVFVDQRGTGPVHGLDCPVAQAKFDTGDMSPDRPEEAMALAKAYAEGCVAEMDKGDFLAHVTTDDAIADSEAFRQAIGAPKVWLYGLSYGTQLVQAYATQHPEAVKGVIVDGVVDLNLSTEGFYASYTEASEKLMDRMFAECRAHAECAADMQRDPGEVYDALAAKLAEGPIEVDFPLGDGTIANRQLNEGLLVGVAFGALYSSSGRSDFLRLLAAAERGDHVPLLLAAYGWFYIDPQTQEALQDPSWFGAAYYAITCTDYSSGTGTPDENAARILDEARAIAPERPRLLQAYFQERLVCAYWPHQGPADRPDPFAGGDYPTLVLNADADPITPITMAYSVLDNVQNGYGIFQAGGPHVILGSETGCPDKTVSAVILDETLPPSRELQCAVDFLGPYTPLTLIETGSSADPLNVAQAVETEIFQSQELALWDGAEAVTIGCNRGGTLMAAPTDRGTDYTFDRCSFWTGLAFSGKGVLVEEDGPEDGLTLEIEIKGNHQGKLFYHNSMAFEAWHLTGAYDGRTIQTTRLLP
ncbi:MAG: alpha/beta hydrolase [Alphaproteobacteria bacterium]|nr:alpha/beta hydrolase [Alphaproteobacteria bacterium]